MLKHLDLHAADEDPPACAGAGDAAHSSAARAQGARCGDVDVCVSPSRKALLLKSRDILCSSFGRALLSTLLTVPLAFYISSSMQCI